MKKKSFSRPSGRNCAGGGRLVPQIGGDCLGNPPPVLWIVLCCVVPCIAFSSLSSVMLCFALYCILYYVKALLSTSFLESKLQFCSKNPYFRSIFDQIWLILALLGGSGGVLGASWGPLGRPGSQNQFPSVFWSSFWEPKWSQNREKSS